MSRFMTSRSLGYYRGPRVCALDEMMVRAYRARPGEALCIYFRRPANKINGMLMSALLAPRLLALAARMLHVP